MEWGAWMAKFYTWAVIETGTSQFLFNTINSQIKWTNLAIYVSEVKLQNWKTFSLSMQIDMLPRNMISSSILHSVHKVLSELLDYLQYISKNGHSAPWQLDLVKHEHNNVLCYSLPSKTRNQKFTSSSRDVVCKYKLCHGVRLAKLLHRWQHDCGQTCNYEHSELTVVQWSHHPRHVQCYFQSKTPWWSLLLHWIGPLQSQRSQSFQQMNCYIHRDGMVTRLW